MSLSLSTTAQADQTQEENKTWQLAYSLSATVHAVSDIFSVTMDPKDNWIDIELELGWGLVEAGSTFTFEITVTNEGDNIDSYTIAASDSAGWDLVQEGQLENIAAGQSKKTTLSVTVPENATVGFLNEITIEVTNLASVKQNLMYPVAVLRPFETNWTYVATGVGVVMVAVVIVLVLWKGPLAGG